MADPGPCQVRHPDEAGAQAIGLAVEVDEDAEVENRGNGAGDDLPPLDREEEGSQGRVLTRSGGETEPALAPAPDLFGVDLLADFEDLRRVLYVTYRRLMQGIRPISESASSASPRLTRTSDPSNPMTFTLRTRPG
jgi:hypothetical protein